MKIRKIRLLAGLIVSASIMTVSLIANSCYEALQKVPGHNDQGATPSTGCLYVDMSPDGPWYSCKTVYEYTGQNCILDPAGPFNVTRTWQQFAISTQGLTTTCGALTGQGVEFLVMDNYYLIGC